MRLKRNKFKRRIAMLLAIMMVASIVPVAAHATDVIEIKSGDLPKSKDWEKQVNEIGEEILAQLNINTADEYEKIIAKVSKEEKNRIENIYDEVIMDVMMDKEGLEIVDH